MTPVLHNLKYLIWIFILNIDCFYGQDNKIDSIQQILKTELHDTTRAKAIAKLGTLFLRKGDLKSALEQSVKAYEFAQKIGFTRLIGTIHNLQGNIYSEMSDFTKALECYQKGISIYNETNDKASMAMAYNNIGLVYYNFSDFNRAIDYIQKALKIQETLDNKYFMAAAIGNIAVLYEKLGDDSLSYVFQLKSYEIHEKMGNKSDMTASLNNLASLSRKKKEFNKALEYLQRSLEIANVLDELKSKVEVHNHFGLFYLDVKKFNEAITEFNLALDNAVKLGDKKLQSEQLSLLGKSFYLNNDPGKALEYYERSYKISETIGSLDDQKNAAEGMYKIYKDRKDISRSLFYHEKFTELKDSVFNSSKNTAFNNLRTQFALDRQEHELKTRSEEELRKKEDEKKQQRFISYIIIGILLLVMVFSYFLYQRFRITNSQKKIIELQKTLVEQKHQALSDSIYYAERIQKAHLPSEKYISKKIDDMKKWNRL